MSVVSRNCRSLSPSFGSVDSPVLLQPVISKRSSLGSLPSCSSSNLFKSDAADGEVTDVLKFGQYFKEPVADGGVPFNM